MRIKILSSQINVDSDLGSLSKHYSQLSQLLINEKFVCMLTTGEITLFNIKGDEIWKIPLSVFLPDRVQGLSWSTDHESFSMSDSKLYLIVHTYPNDRQYTVRISDGCIATSGVYRM